ncbi:MAG: DUF1549 and DUF1553 domain-containing protein [Gemmataceae bacterium]|nr:DUF1549 and DUF1553 domain-containing protein [Gemmataceae bacterium]
MRHAPPNGWLRSTVRPLATALLMAAMFGLSHLADAADKKEDQPTKKEEEKPGKKGKKKGVVVKATGPMTLKMTIASKDADVAEMAKVIDTSLEKMWKENEVTPSHFITDHEFIRRASLDIIGRSATLKEIEVFMKDPVEARRSRLIDRLLSSEDYPRHWANMWSNWLLTRAGDFGRGKYHDQMNVWLEDQFASNKPYNEIVTKLITAKGSNEESGAVNFVLAHVGEPTPAPRRKEEGAFEMVPLTSRITRIFLGTQVQCAQCHAHPFFNGLKQEMFWGVNAYLRQVTRQGGGMRRPARGMALPELKLGDDTSVNTEANVFFELRSGKVKMWHAEFLPSGEKEREKGRGPRLDPKKTGLERREELAKHVIDHEMFPKAVVNRMWGLFFGRGFVAPVDDFNDNNQPSNPELLNELSARLKHYNYDLKKLIRWITHSKAYHLSYVANASNDKPEHEGLFSRMIMKALSPEQLIESMIVATNAEAKETAAKKEMRDRWLSRLVANFGDDEGNEVNFNGTIVQALLMMNGKDINDAIARKGGSVDEAVKNGKTDDGVIRLMYLSALNRLPSAKELTGVKKKFAVRPEFRSKDSAKAAYEDLFWALLNSNEFLLNH